MMASSDTPSSSASVTASTIEDTVMPVVDAIAMDAVAAIYDPKKITNAYQPKFFTSSVDLFDRMIALNIKDYWLQIHQKLIKNPNDLEYITAMKKMYIEELSLLKVDTSRSFWITMPRVIRIWGHLVSELTLELDQNVVGDVYYATLELKINFLINLHELFPNLKAMRFKGTMLWIINQRIHAAYMEAIKKSTGMTQLEYLEVAPPICQSILTHLIRHNLMAGNNLTEIKVSCHLLNFEDQTNLYPSVKTVTLYGCYSSRNLFNVTPDLILTSFPNLNALFLKRMDKPIIEGVPEFLEAIASKLQIETFGVDMSAKLFQTQDDVKINSIPSIRIDIWCYEEGQQVSLSILDHIGNNVKEIWVENWDKHQDNFPMDYFIGKVCINNPSIARVLFVSNDGTVEEVTFNGFTL